MNEILKEHLFYKKNIIKLAKFELIKNYRGAILGWWWAIIKPAIMIFTYWFTFAIGLRMSKTMFDYPYFLWLIAGIIPWFFINDILTNGSNSMRKYNYLINKMNFPISIIPTFTSVSKIYIHILLMIIVLFIFLISGVGINIYIIQLPFYLFMMFIFFTVFSLLTSVLSAISKDFYNLMKSITHMLFWLSGIIWDIDLLGLEWLKKLLYFNPITYIVNGYRNCFIKKVWFFEEPVRLIVFIIITLAVIWLTSWIYKKNRKDIPDIV